MAAQLDHAESFHGSFHMRANAETSSPTLTGTRSPVYQGRRGGGPVNPGPPFGLIIRRSWVQAPPAPPILTLRSNAKSALNQGNSVDDSRRGRRHRHVLHL